MRRFATVGFGLLLCIVSAGCVQPTARSAGPASQVSSAPGASRGTARITIASSRELDFTPYSATPGTYELRNLVNPGVSVFDDRGALRPVLGEAVPTLENNQWKLLPDGRMETIWTLKPGLTWHDGVPLTVDDLAFTIQVGRDRSTGVFGHTAYRYVEDVTTPDARTIAVTWREPYIDADQMFTIWLGWPIPRHILEAPYLQEPASMSQLPFWSTGYVGSGAYRLREYHPGLQVVLEAFDAFTLGRPRVGEIAVMYTPDPNTIFANLLAETADLTVGLGFSVDSAIEMRQRWHEGRFTFEFADTRWFRLDPQFIDPNPAIVTNLNFRRALMYAIDRQEMTDTLQAGLSPVAHTFMAPNQPDYTGIEARVMKYPFDPRRATQLLEEVGYRKGGDGLVRDAAGRSVELDILAQNEASTKPMLSVAAYWQRQGIGSTTSLLAPQRSTDWPYRATFPTFALFTGTHDVPGLPALLSRQARTAENNYEVSGLPNWSRYRNADLDGLVERYLRTIPKGERIELVTQISQHVAENLNTMGLYYFPIPHALANRVANVPIDRGSRASLSWNAHLWDVR